MIKVKQSIKKILYSKKLRLKPYILMESNPDFADNTKAVYDEIIKRGLNLKYKVIWAVNDKQKYKYIKTKNVRFINRTGSILNKVKFAYYNIFSKYIIDCNKYIEKLNKNQIRIFLGHGMPIKVARKYMGEMGTIDYIASTSELFDDVYIDCYKVKSNQIKILGYPRNDVLFNNKQEKIIFPEIKRNKTIIWMPTYRNHNNKDNTNRKSFTYGIPCVSDENELVNINQKLNELNELLLVRLHPAEDLTNIKQMELSNIRLLDDKVLERENATIYDILPQTDALITDYSSVYYDYLLLDKMIGMTIPDFDEYKKGTELFFKYITDFMTNLPAEYIFNYDGLIKFIENVQINNDNYKEQREKKTKSYHKYIDGQSSKRVVDLMLENEEKLRHEE